MNPVHRDVIAGGLAGFVVDVSLFPIDTIKTRFQSKTGFWAAGGLKHISLCPISQLPKHIEKWFWSVFNIPGCAASKNNKSFILKENWGTQQIKCNLISLLFKLKKLSWGYLGISIA